MFIGQNPPSPFLCRILRRRKWRPSGPIGELLKLFKTVEGAEALSKWLDQYNFFEEIYPRSRKIKNENIKYQRTTRMAKKYRGEHLDVSSLLGSRLLKIPIAVSNNAFIYVLLN